MRLSSLGLLRCDGFSGQYMRAARYAIAHASILNAMRATDAARPKNSQRLYRSPFSLAACDITRAQRRAMHPRRSRALHEVRKSLRAHAGCHEDMKRQALGKNRARFAAAKYARMRLGRLVAIDQPYGLKPFVSRSRAKGVH